MAALAPWPGGAWTQAEGLWIASLEMGHMSSHPESTSIIVDGLAKGEVGYSLILGNVETGTASLLLL